MIHNVNYFDVMKRELTNKHLSLVYYIANKINKSFYSSNIVELNDLINYGVIGLINAVNNFNKDINENFQTYAYIKIRGAILDGLDEESFYPKYFRKKCNNIQYPILLDRELLKNIKCDNRINPEAIYANTEIREKIQFYITKLTKMEKKVIDLYFYKGMTLKKIGKKLHYSESYISYRKTDACNKLKVWLQPYYEEEKRL